MLVKHHINGRIKADTLQQEFCPVCKHGESFEHEEHIRSREFGWKNDEMICDTCYTKYIVPTKPAKRITGSYCNDCQFSDCGNCLQGADGIFCKGSIPYYIKTLEGTKMNEQLIKDLDIFKKTRKCPQHHWVESNPFKTDEGTFVITSCAVCHLARVNYNGKLYEDNIMKVVNWIGSNGIKKQVKPVESKYAKIFSEIGLETVAQPPQIPKIEDIFSHAPNQLPPLNFGL